MNEDTDPRRKRRFFGRGALTSLLVHGAILFPLITLAFVLGGREAAQRDEEVAMNFEEVDPTTLPANLPPLDPQAPQPPSPQEPPPPKAPQAVAPTPEPKPAEQTPPEVVEREKPNMKSVDFKIDKEEAPTNARFLAEKNSRAERETRANQTNLEKETDGKAEASSPSDRTESTAGDQETRIAQTEDVASKAGRSAPDQTPRKDESLADTPEPNPKSLLALRDTRPRQHEVTPETAIAELPRDPDGFMPLPPETPESVRDLKGQSGGAPRTQLRLSAQQYKYLFGDDADAAAAIAKKQSSKKAGRFTEHLERIRAAYENFIPEVQPGNQTALNTRAAPFAAFIARMHRSIHELWGFGYLDDLSSKSPTSPLNNPALVTKLEIVLAGDGTVDKVSIIKASGQLPFDTAAIHTVYRAGPYAEPPPAIRSSNGKIYVHWTFHRDDRACGTLGVDYFILDNGGPAKPGNKRTPGAPPPAGFTNDRQKRG